LPFGIKYGSKIGILFKYIGQQKYTIVLRNRAAKENETSLFAIGDAGNIFYLFL
jgi:hypothetical protein